MLKATSKCSKQRKTSAFTFLYARLKNGMYYGNTCGRRAASEGFPLFKLKSFHPVFIKLGENVGGHNISTKFYNHQMPPGTPELWPLNFLKVFLWFLSNLLNMLVGIKSRPSFITTKSPQALLNYGP